MVFSSPLFLFLFLPVVLTVALLLPGTRWRNNWLLLCSIVFYAWGEVGFVVLMLASTLANYVLGLWLDRQSAPADRKRVVALAVFLNIGLLAVFKYGNFAVATLNSGLQTVHLGSIESPGIALPIGISFFTFHAVSYIIDIYRRKSKAATDPRDVALYIFFFPQLIAGPILRWSAICPQLAQRVLTREEFAEGVRRFVGGLAKKVLVANVVAWPADQIFGLSANHLTTSLAWFAMLCYSLQIYFDFSGYSDMAVGLGKMFGFKFLENFDFPYVAQSIREFWRRWHISLSTWFRDYLYIPMGGNRCSDRRNYLNLLIVFFLCGLWHGASWTFVVWGLYHGLFLVAERTRFGTFAERLPRPARQLYALLVVMVGWVLFRADSFAQALSFFRAMCGLAQADGLEPLGRYDTPEIVLAISAGLVFSMPVVPWLRARGQRILAAATGVWATVLRMTALTLETSLVMALLLLSAAWLASGTYNPFIYFRF
jgi:alginate O-acetyltransferase complex protein AlgI